MRFPSIFSFSKLAVVAVAAMVVFGSASWAEEEESYHYSAQNILKAVDFCFKSVQIHGRPFIMTSLSVLCTGCALPKGSNSRPRSCLAARNFHAGAIP